MNSIKRNPNLFLNIPADGLEYAVITDYNASADEYRKNIREYLKVYLDGTAVGTVLLNVFYRRSVVDSSVADSMYYNIVRDENFRPITDEKSNAVKVVCPESDKNFLKGFRYTIKRGIDIIEMAIEEARKYGAAVLLSVRMNDHHDLQDPGLNSSFSYDNPDMNFDYTVSTGSNHNLDYCKKEVRDYYGSYIIELCKNYDIDGIEFDYLRTCPIISRVDDETTQMLTEYMRSLKDRAEENAKRKIRFTARIYHDEKTNLEFGIDAAQWIADGTVDAIVPESWYIPTYYGIPVSAWKESIDKKNTSSRPYCVIPGTDWAVRCDSTNYSGYIMWITLEQLKGFASAMYQKGADGINIFNHFYTDNDMGSHTYYIDKSGNKICKNVIRDKMIAAGSKELAEKGMRAYVHTCDEYHNDLYPIEVSKDKPYTFTANTGTKPKNGYYRVIVGIDEKTDENALRVFVNGAPATGAGDILPAEGFEWKVNDFFEPVASHVSEVCPRVMQFELDDISFIEDGDNTITIETTGKSQHIKWLEIYVEETK